MPTVNRYPFIYRVLQGWAVAVAASMLVHCSSGPSGAATLNNTASVNLSASGLANDYQTVLGSLSPASKAGFISGLRSTSFEQEYNSLLGSISDAPATFDGVTLSGAHTLLGTNKDKIMALASVYPNLGTLLDKSGVDPLKLTADDFHTSSGVALIDDPLSSLEGPIKGTTDFLNCVTNLAKGMTQAAAATAAAGHLVGGVVQQLGSTASKTVLSWEKDRAEARAHEAALLNKIGSACSTADDSTTPPEAS